MQFHPRDGSSFRIKDDVLPPVGELIVCEHGVGARGRRLGETCRELKVGESFRIGGGDSHTGLELLAPSDAPVFIPEVVVEYDPVDAFLAIDFPS